MRKTDIGIISVLVLIMVIVIAVAITVIAPYIGIGLVCLLLIYGLWNQDSKKKEDE